MTSITQLKDKKFHGYQLLDNLGNHGTYGFKNNIYGIISGHYLNHVYRAYQRSCDFLGKKDVVNDFIVRLDNDIIREYNYTL